MGTLKSFRTTACVLSIVMALSGGALRAQADYASTVLANGPVNYWRLNEAVQPPAPDTAINSGSLGAEADGYYVAGAYHPDIGALVGSTDSGASFSGGARVSVPHTPGLNPTGPFSVECWAFKTAGSGYPLGTFSSLQYAGGAERRGWLIYDNDAS